MFDEQPKKRKMSKWVKIPLIIFGVLIVLFYAYFQVGMRMMHDKRYGDIYTVLHIASGRYDGPVLSKTLDRYKGDENHVNMACSMYSSDTGHTQAVPYSRCINFNLWGWGPGCSWWRFQECKIYSVDDLVLTRQRTLGRVLHSLVAPCEYLPSMKEINTAREKASYVGLNLELAVKRFACEHGGIPVPVKVIINVRNDQGNVIAQYIHHPSDH